MTTLIRPIIISLFFLLLSACNTLGLSGQASMRVEVEVYNGPLIKSVHAQAAELSGALLVGEKALHKVSRDARLSRCLLGCYGGLPDRKNKDDKSKQIIDTDYCLAGTENSAQSNKPGSYLLIPEFEDTLHQVCPLLEDIEYGASMIQDKISALNADKTLSQDINSLARVYGIGASLGQIATLLTTEEIRVLSDSTRARIEFFQFAGVAAELSKMLMSRADALLQQTQPGKELAGNLLPTSKYLLTATPTKFLDLGEWTQTKSIKKKQTNAEATRVIKSLINDQHWTLVNTAFATGRGEVAMAFIKDDIGNWSLKSYENNPAELLDGYKNVGLAALKAAATVAGARAPDVSALKSLATTTEQFALGASAPGVTNNFSTLRNFSVSQLQSLQRQAGEKYNELIVEKNTVEQNISALQSDNTELNKKLEIAISELSNTDTDNREAVIFNTRNEEQIKSEVEDIETKIGIQTNKLDQIEYDITQIPGDLKQSAKTILANYKATLESIQKLNL